MSHSQFTLFKTRRFLPLFIAQAIGAFNDNAYRYALAILLIYDLGPRLGFDAALTNTISAGLLIIPFFLFSAPAGQIADKFDKARIARIIKLLEIGIVALGSISLFTDNVYLQLFCVFLAGTQSAFFGPIKYAILPQHLTKDELLGGNGLIEMGTFISVLLGTLFGSIFILHGSGRASVSAVMIVLAVIAFIAALRIPPAPSARPDLKLNPNIASETWKVLQQARSRKEVFQAIMGISWFWLLGVVFLTQIPLFAKNDLNATDQVATFIVAVFTIGIGAGSIFCNRLLKGEVSVKYVPLSAILMTVFIIDLYFATGHAGNIGTAAAPAGISDILSHFSGWRVLADLCLVAFCAGLFVVPLFAVAQTRTPDYRRARIIGANNIMNAIFMTVATGVSAVLIKSGLSARGLFLAAGLANAVAAIYVVRLLPHDLLAGFSRSLFRLLYRVEVRGLENLEAAGRRTLIVANHTSFLDAPILSAFLPEKAAFAIDTQVSKKWWAKPAFALYDLCPIDPGNALALRSLVDMLKRGHRVVIFPEGRITVTGSLMKIYEGPGAVAQMAGANVLPVRIDGAQYSIFSRMAGILPRTLFPKITLTFLPAVKFDAPESLKGSALREFQAAKLYDVMTDMMFRSSNYNRTLWDAMLHARRIHGGKKVILEDINRQPMNYNRLILGSFILGRKIAKLTPNQKFVGVLLPNANATVVAIFGLLAYGRVPAMLNFSTGAVNMSAACTAAQVRTIITSRKFVEAGEMQDDINVLSQNCNIVYLEDVRETVGIIDKASGLLCRFFASLALAGTGAEKDVNAPALVLFTSGSEGVPKGVVLSHRNLNANHLQILTRISLTPRDIMFAALPVFHAFGFLGGVVLPALNGMRAFLYPSPLHYKIVPELVYDTNATILFSTDTFLAGYARTAHPYDFQSVRLLVGGAERVKPETRAIYMERFGLRIIEGYGATECSPVIAANTFMHNRTGTVGRIFDGMEFRIEPVEGITEGGRLFIRGPNVMLGYLRADNPGVIEPPAEGWHDTGDIVTVDEWRYVTILGRAKRFCKVAGEMISLTALEAKLQQLYPESAHAIVAVPDAKKGEQLVLFTTLSKPDRKEIAAGLKKLGCSELMIPKSVFPVEQLPVLGSGKTDYVTINRLAREKVPA